MSEIEQSMASPENTPVPEQEGRSPEVASHLELATVYAAGKPEAPGDAGASTASAEAKEEEGAAVQADALEGEEPEALVERFILLLRHGIAEERSADKPDDERKLTKKGAQRMREIGQGLAEIFPGLDAIITSPLVRAVQTGVCLTKGYGKKTQVRMSEALEPGQSTLAFKNLLDSLPLRRVILVGHEPDLTRLLGDLCGLDTWAMELKKGGCYGIRIKESGEMRLEWMLSPAVMRRLG